MLGRKPVSGSMPASRHIQWPYVLPTQTISVASDQFGFLFIGMSRRTAASIWSGVFSRMVSLKRRVTFSSAIRLGGLIGHRVGLEVCRTWGQVGSPRDNSARSFQALFRMCPLPILIPVVNEAEGDVSIAKANLDQCVARDFRIKDAVVGMPSRRIRLLRWQRRNGGDRSH